MKVAATMIGPGDHAALVYRTRDEQLRWVSAYVREGLERKERCFYIAHDNSVPAILSRLASSGINTQAEQKRGALVVLTREQSYFKYGMFEPRRMIQDLTAEVDRALKNGFTGLRASGEMTWALDVPEALAQLREYEVNLHRSFGPKLTGLCQYDETRFDAEFLSHVIRVHPKLIANNRVMENPHHRTPDELIACEWPMVSSADLPGGM